MKFNNPPKNLLEKEKRAEAFINFMDAETPKPPERQRVKEKEPTHTFSIKKFQTLQGFQSMPFASIPSDQLLRKN